MCSIEYCQKISYTATLRLLGHLFTQVFFYNEELRYLLRNVEEPDSVFLLAGGCLQGPKKFSASIYFIIISRQVCWASWQSSPSWSDGFWTWRPSTASSTPASTAFHLSWALFKQSQACKRYRTKQVLWIQIHWNWIRIQNLGQIWIWIHGYVINFERKFF